MQIKSRPRTSIKGDTRTKWQLKALVNDLLIHTAHLRRGVFVYVNVYLNGHKSHFIGAQTTTNWWNAQVLARREGFGRCDKHYIIIVLLDQFRLCRLESFGWQTKLSVGLYCSAAVPIRGGVPILCTAHQSVPVSRKESCVIDILGKLVGKCTGRYMYGWVNTGWVGKQR